MLVAVEHSPDLFVREVMKGLPSDGKLKPGDIFKVRKIPPPTPHYHPLDATFILIFSLSEHCTNLEDDW